MNHQQNDKQEWIREVLAADQPAPPSRLADSVLGVIAQRESKTARVRGMLLNGVLLMIAVAISAFVIVSIDLEAIVCEALFPLMLLAAGILIFFAIAFVAADLRERNRRATALIS